MFKNNKGIGLIEVLIAAGLAGGLAITIAKMTENSAQGTKQIEAKAEGINLKGIIQNILSNPTACQFTFSTLITDPNLSHLSANLENELNVPSIRDKVNDVAYSTASTNISPLKIEKIFLTNFKSTVDTIDLVVETTFKRSKSVTQVVKPIRIPLNFNIASPTSLIGCSTMAVGGEWLLGGNAGTNPATDYLGTSDNQPLIFRVNAIESGMIGQHAVYLGQNAGGNNDFKSVAIGQIALANNTTGDGNVAIGTGTMSSNTEGGNNTAIGISSLAANTTGNDNIAVGMRALGSNQAGSENIAIGINALGNSTVGTKNIAIGSSALLSNTTGTRNTTLGESTLRDSTIANDNTAIGNMALMKTTTGGSNTALGKNAGFENTTGASNTAIGFQALQANQAGFGATALGSHALSTANPAHSAVAVGYLAMSNALVGGTNTAVGAGALRYSETGHNNSAFGGYALGNLRTGDYNTAIGRDAMYMSQTAEGNTAIGYQALSRQSTGGNNNVAIGQGALHNNGQAGTTAGNNNVALGNSAGAYNQSGNNNVYIGYQAGRWANHSTGSNNVYIGPFAGNNNALAADASNKFILANTASSTGILIEGSFDTGYVRIPRKLHTGNWYPSNFDTSTGSIIFSDQISASFGSVNNNSFNARFSGGFNFYTHNASAPTGVGLAAGGSSWGSPSDRNIKENIEEIDPEEHLKKISKLPVFKWNYIGSTDPHMGPMAQDFYYIFRLGNGNDKVITTQDIEGVTIVAVKALEKRTKELRKENEDLKKRIARLEALLIK